MMPSYAEHYDTGPVAQMLICEEAEEEARNLRYAEYCGSEVDDYERMMALIKKYSAVANLEQSMRDDLWSLCDIEINSDTEAVWVKGEIRRLKHLIKAAWAAYEQDCKSAEKRRRKLCRGEYYAPAWNIWLQECRAAEKRRDEKVGHADLVIDILYHILDKYCAEGR